MTSKQKKVLYRIIIATVLIVVVSLLTKKPSDEMMQEFEAMKNMDN